MLQANSTLTVSNHWDHLKARLGVNRMGHRVPPGLYALGTPNAGSPVFVSANYTLSFDALRSSLRGFDGYLLVLDTKGVNVWCAAGKGTFGTQELVNRIKMTGLGDVVQHRTLVLPQLGAPGVSSHEVRKQSGFRVEYGPVRARDLPEYLKNGGATPAMRRVRFTLADRLAVSTIEVVHALVPMLVAAVLAFLIGGGLAAGAMVVAILGGVLLFPAFLPWLPTRRFSSKGFFLGILLAIPFAIAPHLRQPSAAWWFRSGSTLAYLLVFPPLTAFLALLFTGSTTFTSRTGVRREIFACVPPLAWSFGAGLLLAIILVAVRLLGGGLP